MDEKRGWREAREKVPLSAFLACGRKWVCPPACWKRPWGDAWKAREASQQRIGRLYSQGLVTVTGGNAGLGGGGEGAF